MDDNSESFDKTAELTALNATTISPHLDLVEACKKGDRTAQFRIYQLYSRAMYNICVRILGDTAAAEDALQEAFVSAFRKLNSFEGRSTFGAWLKRIVINKCVSTLQRNKMEFEPLEHAEAEAAIDPVLPETILPRLDANTIQQAIDTLPEGCKVIFSLYQLEGYDHQEIADILGVSVSTSKSQFHRAKKLLQERLQQHYQS
ncbi:MAG: RNA polymerase sigma factor [Bacteroidia bacterium]|nr:RNA polymerase sigma factor [Bacteroidia bacterium]